jgi:hypothetical protein
VAPKGIRLEPEDHLLLFYAHIKNIHSSKEAIPKEQLRKWHTLCQKILILLEELEKSKKGQSG